MEDLLQTQAYSQPFSIMCMELCIKDVNESTVDLLKKNPATLTFVNTPSWKFPHINIDKLEILPIMEKYRNKTYTECQQYQELLELLIDRVCFSLLTTIKLLGSTLTSTNAGTTPANSSRSSGHHGQGDSSAVFLKSVSSKQSLLDNNTHPNVGVLLKQLFSTVSSVLEARSLEMEKNRKKLNKPKFYSSSTQTNDSSSEGCETCLVSVNLLKFLATMITQSLTIFSPTSSQIAKLRQDGDSIWTLSQKEYLYEWCDALQTDCRTLLEKTSQVFEDKVVLQKLYDECKANLDSEIKKTKNLSSDFHKKLKVSQEAFELESGRNQDLEQQVLIQKSKSKDLQVQLQVRVDEVQTLQGKVSELSKSLQQVSEWHKHLHETSSGLEKAKLGLEQEVVTLRESVSFRQKEVTKAEALVGLKDAEIDLLKSSLDKAKGEKVKKDEMKSLLEKAKKQLEACKKVEDESKRVKLGDKLKIEKLQEDLTTAQEQIELLTLYPDLNGPINPPTPREAQNPLQAMANQVKSNQLRIQVLQCQTERLNTTLEKCNNSNKSKTNRVQFNI